jgi:hypothetical protein
LELGTNVLQFDDLIWDEFEESTDDMKTTSILNGQLRMMQEGIFNRSHHFSFEESRVYFTVLWGIK